MMLRCFKNFYRLHTTPYAALKKFSYALPHLAP